MHRTVPDCNDPEIKLLLPECSCIFANCVRQGLLEPGHITRPKNFKTPFFRDISNSFMWVTQSCLKPHQKFFFEKILKTDAASPILRFF